MPGARLNVATHTTTCHYLDTVGVSLPPRRGAARLRQLPTLTHAFIYFTRAFRVAPRAALPLRIAGTLRPLTYAFCCCLPAFSWTRGCAAFRHAWITQATRHYRATRRAQQRPAHARLPVPMAVRFLPLLTRRAMPVWTASNTNPYRRAWRVVRRPPNPLATSPHHLRRHLFLRFRPPTVCTGHYFVRLAAACRCRCGILTSRTLGALYRLLHCCRLAYLTRHATDLDAPYNTACGVTRTWNRRASLCHLAWVLY